MVCVLRNSSEFLFLWGNMTEENSHALANTVVNGFADLLIGWSVDSCWRIFSENIFLFEKDELNLYPKTHQHETRIQRNP
jgi:hypothetical protein